MGSPFIAELALGAQDRPSRGAEPALLHAVRKLAVLRAGQSLRFFTLRMLALLRAGQSLRFFTLRMLAVTVV